MFKCLTNDVTKLVEFIVILFSTIFNVDTFYLTAVDKYVLVNSVKEVTYSAFFFNGECYGESMIDGECLVNDVHDFSFNASTTSNINVDAKTTAWKMKSSRNGSYDTLYASASWTAPISLPIL